MRSMHRWRILVIGIGIVVGGSNSAQAGLYYSGETYAELPAQWRGFLLDQRTLRNIAVSPQPGKDENPARTHYLEEAAQLEKKGRLGADEKADLGALYVRLGAVNKAVESLRAAQGEHPNHFYIAANLGTAWQLQGNLAQAADALQHAVRLAPGKLQAAEELHLKLVRLRLQQQRAPADLDDLCTAASLYDGCVVQFGMNHPELRRRRQLVRAAVDDLPKAAVGDKSAHEE